MVETCDRLSPSIPDHRVILILGKEHLEEATTLFEGGRCTFWRSPWGGTTAPCMGLGALYGAASGIRSTHCVLPADHFISKPEVFLKDLESAGKLTADGGIVTLGIVPTRPETGYGVHSKKIRQARLRRRIPGVGLRRKARS